MKVQLFKKALLTVSLSLAGIAIALANPKVPDQSKPIVTAYLLLSSNDTSGDADDSIAVLQKYADGTLPINFNRLDLAFLRPHLDNWNYTGTLNDLFTAGVITEAQNQASQYQSFNLKAVVDQLHAKGVQVFISVGGWAYSNCRKTDYTQCQINPTDAPSDNFPLSPAVINGAAPVSGRPIPYNPAVQTADPSVAHFNNEIQNWVNFATAYDFDGIDLDYEESWYATGYANTFVSPSTPGNAILNAAFAAGHKWDNMPLIMPQSIEKYGLILNQLEQDIYNYNQNPTNGISLILSVAAPSVAAFDIHGSNSATGFLYWKPQPTQTGNLKGIYYDLIHAKVHPSEENTDFALYDPSHYSDPILQQTFTNLPYLLAAPSAASTHEISGIQTIGIMSYDLDDGDDYVGSTWCINSSQLRNPADNLGINVDCSILEQTQSLVKMFNTLYTNNSGGSGNIVTPPAIAFGLEVGFPNYPINLDSSLPGGGNQSNSAFYRWNDPWVVYDIPVTTTAGLPNMPSTGITNNIYPTNTPSPAYGGQSYPINMHNNNYLVVNNALFTSMKQLGANGGVIVWSIANPFYDQFLNPKTVDGDYQLYYLNNNSAPFGVDAANYTWGHGGATPSGLGAVFMDAADPDFILNTAYDVYQ